MDRNWHIGRGQTKSGPYSAAELGRMAADGDLLRTDLVWKPGMAGWQKAGEVWGLFGAAPAGSPPALGPPVEQGDGTGGLIPYKNPKALIAYYTGLFLSPCCIVGLPYGILPLTLGILGLRDRGRSPWIKGSLHAWIGIVLGGLSVVMTVVFWVLVACGVSFSF